MIIQLVAWGDGLGVIVMTNIILKSLAGVAILAATPAIAQTNYDTTVAGGSDIYSIGVPDTSTYGQVFTVGADNVLNSFSLFLDDQYGSSGSANFKAISMPGMAARRQDRSFMRATSSAMGAAAELNSILRPVVSA